MVWIGDRQKEQDQYKGSESKVYGSLIYYRHELKVSKKKKKKNESFHKRGWGKMGKKYNINSVLIPYTKDSVYLRTKYKRPSNKIFRR